MKITVLTLFPQTIEAFLKESIIKKAQDKKLVEINVVNIRDYAEGNYKTVDDKPYGGGSGMVLKADTVHSALKAISPKPYAILLSASGSLFKQTKARDLSKKKNIALICGHYEGVDARVENIVDEVIAIGDFVLTGGELPAMVVADSVVRLLPGAINPASTQEESFQDNLLEYPQYTRPEVYKGLKVPSVLLGGNHNKIKRWREKESLKRTKKYRPDLLK